MSLGNPGDQSLKTFSGGGPEGVSVGGWFLGAILGGPGVVYEEGPPGPPGGGSGVGVVLRVLPPGSRHN